MKGLSSGFGKNSNKIRIILVMFLVVYHLFLFYSLSNEPVLLMDSDEYINSAISFEANTDFFAGPQTIEKDYRLYSKRTPFYPLVLSSFRYLNLHWNYVYILQVFLGLFNVYLVFLLLRKLTGNGSGYAYFYLTLFILFTPSQFIYSQFIMADLWLQTFIMVSLLSFLKYFDRRNPWWLVGLIIFSTLGSLTKPVFLPASFGIAILCLFYFFSQKQQKVLALSVVIPFLSWFTICSQNERLTGVFHYSSIGYINLLHYNTNLYLNKAIGKSETEKLLEPLMIVPHSKKEFKSNYQEVNKVCKSAILNSLGGYLVFHMKGMVYFFLDPGRFDLYNFFRIEEGNSKGFLHKGANKDRLKTMFRTHPMAFIGLTLVFMINIFKTIGFLGFIYFNRKSTIMWAGAILVFYIAFLTGPLGASRFALPVALIVMCFASVFYSGVSIKFFQNSKRWKRRISQ